MVSQNQDEDDVKDFQVYFDLLTSAQLVFSNNWYRASEQHVCSGLSVQHRELLYKELTLVKSMFCLVSIFYLKLQQLWEVSLYFPQM